MGNLTPVLYGDVSVLPSAGRNRGTAIVTALVVRGGHRFTIHVDLHTVIKQMSATLSCSHSSNTVGRQHVECEHFKLQLASYSTARILIWKERNVIRSSWSVSQEITTTRACSCSTGGIAMATRFTFVPCLTAAHICSEVYVIKSMRFVKLSNRRVHQWCTAVLP